MAAQRRLNAIKQLIFAQKRVEVSRLSQQFGVTEETIRRDLEKLASQGVITRTYGGAVLNTETALEGISFYKRARTRIEAKQKIAQRAAELLATRTTAAADSSSTVMEALRLLKDRRDMTLLTNSVEALCELGTSEISVVSTGGVLNRSSCSLQGSIAKSTIQNYNVDILLMSCKGLVFNKGALDSNEAEAEVKKAMIAQAVQLALLLDHTKFGQVAFVQLSELDQIDYIVTDEKPNDEWMELFQKKHIQVIY